MEREPHIVIIDDEKPITDALHRVTRAKDRIIHVFNHSLEALEFVKTNHVDLIVTDFKMPELNGIELLSKCKKFKPDLKALMISAYQDFDAVSQGFNTGVLDQFLSKPWDNRELKKSVHALLTLDEKRSEAALSDNKHEDAKLYCGMLSKDKSMRVIFDQIKRVACANVPVFIHGESGTGKELVAKACHLESINPEAPFVAVNCANFSETLIESQLFGYQKGAFTGADRNTPGLFETVENGTLFLDEVTTLDMSLQAKLLRVLQEREYSPLGSQQLKPFRANVVTASSTSLVNAVEAGDFREDLYYRLYVVGINLPPLRKRGQDIILLANHFLKRFNRELGKRLLISPSGLVAIAEFSWPGNVRQLENFMQSLVAMCPTDEASDSFIYRMLDERRLSSSHTRPVTHAIINAQNNAIKTPTAKSKSVSDIIPLWQTEKNVIQDAIEICGGNVVKAAAVLEVSPSTLYRKIQAWEEQK